MCLCSYISYVCYIICTILQYVSIIMHLLMYVSILHAYFTAPLLTAPTVIVTPLSSRSFTVSWRMTDPDHNYIITWTNLRTGIMDNMTVAENTNSYTVTGLSGRDNYNVTVTANNSCGMMMSYPMTIYGENV